MSDVVFSFPGKIGDAILQFPVAYQWHKQTGKTFSCWLDETSLKPLERLFSIQPCVGGVEFKAGIEHYMCGGQPWHFNLQTADYAGKTVYHLGFRGFPQRQITLETAENAKLPVKIDMKALATEPCFVLPAESPPPLRLVLHGQPICPHTRCTPGFWKFLSSIAPEVEHLFDEVLFVGKERDCEVGVRTYPEWGRFDDGGDLANVAQLIANSTCVIGCGSSMAALASVLKVPTIRVHDPIGNASKTVWSGLGDNQLNDTEVELRRSWPEFRERWLKPVVAPAEESLA